MEEQLKKDKILREKELIHELIRKDTDNHLISVTEILKNTHEIFFQSYDEKNKIYDVKPILSYLKKRTLLGCHVLFSGVIEHGMDPKRHRSWCMAQAFGATCHTERNPQVTHIVARRGGTEKIKEAKKQNANVYLVSDEWLHQSIFHWKRLDEHQYPVWDYTTSTPGACPVLLGDRPTIVENKPAKEQRQIEKHHIHLTIV